MIRKLAATYSVIACDRNQMGAAVQSHFFGVGSVVPWSRPMRSVTIGKLPSLVLPARSLRIPVAKRLHTPVTSKPQRVRSKRT